MSPGAAPTGDASGDVFHALADPTRREVVRLLSERGALSASALARELGAEGRSISRQGVAKHLAILRDAGLADVEREGREARYRFEPAPLGDAISWMAAAGARWDQRLERLRDTLPR
ncbi:metalloregulator ArsR/SmtB family transcription factor [Conexibacter sp. SYSU D00693]|uniref:ArsR/SmtB family transcription factor n=1 Tax=Conexibacter sp. SYSU D00693 TaxID=2812560 RepID=UPI001F11F8B8|nr:metalloregulator ArsR/SmtB family transcription factor [Conexibacter sp. SYSU D00693]